MKPLSVLLVLLALAPAVFADRKPNVILIMSDDHGSADAGCYGSEDLHTPHLDALMESGIRFNRFYAAAPVCSPSRAATLTGRYPARTTLVSNGPSFPGDRGGLPEKEITLGEMFRDAGYATAHIGKWHLGYTPGRLPLDQGFEHSFGHMAGCIDNYSHFFYWSGPNRHDLHRNGEPAYHDGEFFPALMVREAADFMEKNRERPFFIYYALNTPHYPYQGEAKWLEHFKGLPENRRLYAAFLATQDEYLGKLMKRLDDLGLRENTIVVFQSDNGHSTEERAHNGGGSAGKFRGAKFSLFEGGIRLPASITWPKRFPAEQQRDHAVHAVDLLPTLAELTGLKLPDTHLDGRSLVPILDDPDHAGFERPLHWQYRSGPQTEVAVLDGDWKLLLNARDTSESHKAPAIPVFLANLAEDPGETTNLAEDHPEIVERLRKLHEGHLKEP